MPLSPVSYYARLQAEKRFVNKSAVVFEPFVYLIKMRLYSLVRCVRLRFGCIGKTQENSYGMTREKAEKFFQLLKRKRIKRSV